MDILLGILLTLFIFTFIVFIHEGGHFLAARFTRMRVEEFGIGIPPRAKTIGKDKKGTIYTLNWLPIGGFVRIKGEDPEGENAHDIDAFSAKKWWARALVIIAGVTMNFLLAMFIFFGMFLFGTKPLAVNPVSETSYGSYFLPSFEEALHAGYVLHDGIRIDPIHDGLAEKSGLLPGDIIHRINNTQLTSIDTLITLIQKDSLLEFEVSGTGGMRNVFIRPDAGKIHAYLRYENLHENTNFRLQLDFGQAFLYAGRETIILSRITGVLLFSTLEKLIAPKNPQEREDAKELISGPIGMGAGMIDLVHLGIDLQFIFLMIALLSINLGVLNILPFPALDGGRLVSTTLVSLLGLFMKEKSGVYATEKWIHSIGMIILLGLSLVVAFFDILKL